MRVQAAPVRIGVLGYPGAQEAAVHGLRDLFETANRLHAAAGARSPGLDVVVLRSDGGPPEPVEPLHVLILPPCLGEGAPREWPKALVAWIGDRHRDGTLLCSVCVGAFLLAQTGLLSGRPATTHWGLKSEFGSRFPDVALDVDRLIVDDGDVITAGGVMAWIDLGLNLVGRALGTSVQLETARFFLVDPGGREQRFYSRFAPAFGHGDDAIRKVQLWLQSKRAEKVSVPAMAARAGLGERTFLRRFRRATGLRPVEYMQHLRAGKARELLERSDLAVDEVAWRVGYEDAAAFRKVFLRVVGLSPGEYRRRFTCARSGAALRSPAPASGGRQGVNCGRGR